MELAPFINVTLCVDLKRNLPNFRLQMNNEYNGEWDQMFNDIMTNRVPNQDSSSDLKDLYSQISKTIDLLNS